MFGEPELAFIVNAKADKSRDLYRYEIAGYTIVNDVTDKYAWKRSPLSAFKVKKNICPILHYIDTEFV